MHGRLLCDVDYSGRPTGSTSPLHHYCGPNGSGKTTFAKEFLLREAGVIHFVNADLIAGGLSPSARIGCKTSRTVPPTGALRLAKSRKNFSFESTLSGRTYLHLLQSWKATGYTIRIVFLSLPSPQLALQRVAARVEQGGHDVPRVDVIRRFHRNWHNFQTLYRPLADTWSVYENSGDAPRLLEEGP